MDSKLAKILKGNLDGLELNKRDFLKLTGTLSIIGINYLFSNASARSPFNIFVPPIFQGEQSTGIGVAQSERQTQPARVSSGLLNIQSPVTGQNIATREVFLADEAHLVNISGPNSDMPNLQGATIDSAGTRLIIPVHTPLPSRDPFVSNQVGRYVFTINSSQELVAEFQTITINSLGQEQQITCPACHLPPATAAAIVRDPGELLPSTFQFIKGLHPSTTTFRILINNLKDSNSNFVRKEIVGISTVEPHDVSNISGNFNSIVPSIPLP